MQSTFLATLLALALASAQGHAAPAAPAAQRQAPPEQAPPGRPVTQRPAPAPTEAQEREQQRQEREKEKQREEAARKDKEVALAKLRAEFGEDFFRCKQAATEELAVARERAGADEVAFAAARTEIARKYRGLLAELRRSYAERARGLGVSFELPGDDIGLEQTAAVAAPAAALRSEFVAQVTALARAAQRELAAAQETAGADAQAFAAKRTEIARRYRGQVLGLQQSIARRAAEQDLKVDTTDVAKLMEVLAAAEAPPGNARAQKPPQEGDRPKPGADPSAPPGSGNAPPAARPLDSESLRAAFTKQVEALRAALVSELRAADAAFKGDELAAKRASIVQKHRVDLASYRANVAARAQAAGVTVALPADEVLVPELGPPPKDATDGKQPPKPGDPKQPSDGAEPPKDAPPPGNGGKPGRGPRFGGGGKPAGGGG